MTISLSLTGSRQVQAALRDMSSEMEREVSKAVIGTAMELRANIVKSIQRGPASGRIRRNGSRASAPGQPPMSDTGRLANSITFDKRGPIMATVGSALVYSVFLEYGTSRMAARPFFRPAAERMRPKFNKRLEKAIQRASP